MQFTQYSPLVSSLLSLRNARLADFDAITGAICRIFILKQQSKSAPLPQIQKHVLRYFQNNEGVAVEDGSANQRKARSLVFMICIEIYFLIPGLNILHSYIKQL